MSDLIYSGKSYTGMTDPDVPDADVCSRVWTMTARRGGFTTSRWDDNESEDETMGGRGRTAEETADIVKRLKAGEHPKTIADDIDRVETFVRKVAKEEGVELPDRRGGSSKGSTSPAPKSLRRPSQKPEPLDSAEDSLIEQLRGEARKLRERAEKLEAAATSLES